MEAEPKKKRGKGKKLPEGKIVRAFKTELDPTPEQIEILRRWIGQMNFVYNSALLQRRGIYGRNLGVESMADFVVPREEEEYKKKHLGGKKPTAHLELPRKYVSFQDQNNELTETFKLPEFSEFREPPRISFAATLQNLQRGYNRAFKQIERGEKPGFPVYHSQRKGHGSLKFFTEVNAGDQWIRIPKLGIVRLKEKEYIPVGKYWIASAAVTTRANRWFVSVTLHADKPSTIPGSGILAIHLGLNRLATLYDGENIEIIENPRFLEKSLGRLGRLQQAQSKKKKGSREHKRLGSLITKLHYHIAQQRRDAAHKLTTDLLRTRRYSKIIIENWNISKMLSSKDPETVKLARRISDAGWGEILRQIKYKGLWYDSEIVELEAFSPTARECHICNHVNPVPTDTPKFTCEKCGIEAHADDNAVKNVFARGLGTLVEA